MKTYDILGYSFSAIKLRKLRAALTTLGVIIGIAAIVALLSITQGLQVSITSDLNRGLSSTTLVVVPGSNALGAIGGTGGLGGGRASRATGTTGLGLGGSGAGSSGFALYVNYTSQIDALSPDIVSSMAVIERAGYVEADGMNNSVTIYGVDFGNYSQLYSTTFVAASGNIPSSQTNNDVVVGARVNDPRENGTLLFNSGDNVGIVWANATTLPVINETYTA